jgi:hypothetical protein
VRGHAWPLMGMHGHAMVIHSGIPPIRFNMFLWSNIDVSGSCMPSSVEYWLNSRQSSPIQLLSISSVVGSFCRILGFVSNNSVLQHARYEHSIVVASVYKRLTQFRVSDLVPDSCNCRSLSYPSGHILVVPSVIVY